ncbi:MAG: bifunctional riboflavin kinase/FAD synthetase [Clostridia bacterium]|nr:bifunctional riboflavin kinase/FAD synthetase [Clostridia bacterium]
MQTVHADYKKVNTAGGTAVAIGNFDGVHKGHKKLLSVLKEAACERGVPSVVYTFLEHPRNVILGEGSQKLIYENSAKEKFIGDTGVHTLFFEDFNSVRHLEAEEFVKEILIDKLNIKVAVIGTNGKFGKKSLGTSQMLKEFGKRYGFDVFVVEPVVIGDVVCSSTEVRAAIEAGDFKKCESLLGRPYSVRGTVVADKRLGRTYGFPTANIIPDQSQTDIKRGVYATNTHIGEKVYKSITNVGTTSFDNPEKLRIETHILDFSGDLYGKIIEVEFLCYMRGFRKFANTDELKEQLIKDNNEVRRMLV